MRPELVLSAGPNILEKGELVEVYLGAVVIDLHFLDMLRWVRFRCSCLGSSRSPAEKRTQVRNDIADLRKHIFEWWQKSSSQRFLRFVWELEEDVYWIQVYSWRVGENSVRKQLWLRSRKSILSLLNEKEMRSGDPIIMLSLLEMSFASKLVKCMVQDEGYI